MNDRRPDLEKRTPEEWRNRLREVLRTDRPEDALFDWYGDASLSDDLTHADSEWYIFVLLGINRHSDRRKTWEFRHATEFSGHIHCSARGGGLRPEVSRDIIGERYPDIVSINIIHKKVFTAWMDREMSERGSGPVSGDMLSAAFWGMMLIKVQGTIGYMLGHGDESAREQAMKRHMGSLILNNRSSGDTEPFVARIAQLSGVVPTFAPGGSPWIDLADVYAWSAKRVLVQDEVGRWPDPPPEFTMWDFPTLTGEGPKCSTAKDAQTWAAKIQVDYRRVNGEPVPPELLQRSLRPIERP